MNLEKLEKMVAIFEKLYWVQDNEYDEDIKNNISCALEHLAHKIAVEAEKEEGLSEAFIPHTIYTNDSMPLGTFYTTEQVNIRKKLAEQSIENIEKAFKE